MTKYMVPVIHTLITYSKTEIKSVLIFYLKENW